MEFVGIEGVDDNVDMNQIQNITLDAYGDSKVDWPYYGELIDNINNLYASLNYS